MIIYKTTNLINGKFYVGKDEKNNPDYLGSGKILKLALLKYGKESFKKEILEICKTRKELNDREKYWINFLSATTNGYNITEGGIGGQTKFRKIYQFNKNGTFIKEWSSAAEIDKILGFDESAILKVCKGQLLSFKGFIWSFSNSINSYRDTRTVSVLQYSKEGKFIKEWESIKVIKDFFNISDRHIQLTLDKSNRTAKGFIWLRKNGEIKQIIIRQKSGCFNNKNAKKKIK